MRKILITVLLGCAMYFGAGCMDTAKYNYAQDQKWLTQQLQQGKITQQQYDIYSTQIAK